MRKRIEIFIEHSTSNLEAIRQLVPPLNFIPQMNFMQDVRLHEITRQQPLEVLLVMREEPVYNEISKYRNWIEEALKSSPSINN